MKVFENNAIKQILVYAISIVLVVLVLVFSISGNYKTRNRHKSLTQIFGSHNKTFSKWSIIEIVAKNRLLMHQMQSIENFGDGNKKKILGFKGKIPKKRDKRFILFNNGGVVKLVLGTSYPVTLADPSRSLSYFYNLHLQYVPPPIPLYWWSLYNTTTFPASKRIKRQTQFKQQNRDISREMIYEAIKGLLERAGLPGEACLLQMICEITAKPFNVTSKGNIFHEFLNAIFIPTMENVDEKYLNACNVGHNGAMCDYSCPNEINWLKRNTILF